VGNALSRNGEESFKTLLDPDPEADGFLNLISSSLSTDTSVVTFRGDPFSSFYVKLLTNRQTNRRTDRQTNKGQYITSLAGVMMMIIINKQPMGIDAQLTAHDV